MNELRPLFLLSLPRSGSTLLQRMLAAHSRISTSPEPWILLPHLYSTRGSGVFTEYGHHTAVSAIDDFCRRLPWGHQAYRREIREMALRLYTRAGGPEARYFLDKTPRYSLVADEVFDLFPDAAFVVLWRNPLAVLASILDSWLHGRWEPYLHKVDLFEGLERLLDACERNRARVVSLRYEDLVTDPAVQTARLLDHLDLAWEPDVVHGVPPNVVRGAMGDQTGVREYRQVSRESLTKWPVMLTSPVRKAWCRRWLRWIGPRRLALMGYDLEELVRAVDETPLRLRSLGPDLALTAKGTLWSVAEPRIIRRKLAVLPQWHRVYSHT